MKLSTRDITLSCSFAAVYALLWVSPLLPVIGAQGRFFPLATIMAPLIGLILGPYVGASAVAIGGFIGWTVTQSGPLFFLSFVPGVAAAFFSGLLYNHKSLAPVGLYIVSVLVMVIFPTVGPGWLFPYFFWFHLIGILVLISPLTSKAVDHLHKHTSLAELSFGVGVISFTATMFAHSVGNLLFQMIYFPALEPQVDFWLNLWQVLTLVYPVERILIALLSVIVGVPIIQALRTYGFEIGGIRTDGDHQDKNRNHQTK